MENAKVTDDPQAAEKIVDADGHMVEPPDLWDSYIEPKYRDVVPKVRAVDGLALLYEPDGKFVAPAGKRPHSRDEQLLEQKYGESFRDRWSSEARLKDMDTYGWTTQVLFPTSNNGNFAYRVALKDLELGAAMCRAYNNWAHEYCSAAPDRLKFAAILPGSDVGEMTKEARRAVGELGAVSVRNPLLPKGRWLHEPEYDALWGLASDMDFPISAHGENRYRFEQFHDAVGDEATAASLRGLDHALAFPCDNMAVVGHFIFGGVLEKFPKLRVALLESNAGWLPWWLGRMDGHSHGRLAVMGNPDYLPMLPSDYFKRQCTISCDSDESALEYATDYFGGENLVWNTDYPHPDAQDPARALPDFTCRLSPEHARRILFDNALTLFGPRLLNRTA